MFSCRTINNKYTSAVPLGVQSRLCGNSAEVRFWEVSATFSRNVLIKLVLVSVSVRNLTNGAVTPSVHYLSALVPTESSVPPCGATLSLSLGEREHLGADLTVTRNHALMLP